VPVSTDELLQKTYWPGVRAAQAFQWVNVLLGVAKSLESEGPRSPYRNRFWIPFYGVLVDIGPAYKTVHIKTSGAVAPIIVQIEKLDQEVQQKVQEMRAKLSREECILVEYRRHGEAHVFQDKYRLRERNGQPESLKIELLGARAPLEEVDKVITDYTKRYLGKEDVFTAEIATRMRPLIDNLYDLFHALQLTGFQLQAELAKLGELE
jgi:hypothetical protein